MQSKKDRITCLNKTAIIVSLMLAVCLIAGQALAANHETAYERVNNALQDGKLSPKQALMLQADILFNSQMLSASSPYRVKPGDARAGDAERQEFFEDVYRLYESLGKSEKDYLASLSPELSRVLTQAAAGQPPAPRVDKPRRPSAADRINLAVAQGRLDLKTSVMLRAQLRFAHRAAAGAPEFAPRAGEALADEECGTGFFKDVHRVFAQLSPQEIGQLKSLDPGLASLLQVKESEAGRVAPPARALPNPADWGLDKQIEGKNCVIHYTLAGANAVADETTAAKYKIYMDMAIGSNMVKHFRKAFPEDGGKLHVYVYNIGGNGEWVDVSTVAGKQKSGYIKLSNKIKANFGNTWEKKLKGVSFHEYFHGIQSAYNWNSDLWFMEATTVWASCYYGADYAHVSSYYSDADSMFNNTNQSLWVNTYRKYSTSVMAFIFSGKYSGYKFIKSYFEGTETQDDAIVVLKAVLATKKATFEEEMRNIWMSMYAKKVGSVSKYVPAVEMVEAYNAYGEGPVAGTVNLTGARFYEFQKQVGNKGKVLVMCFKPGAGTGNPEGFFMKGKSVKKYTFDANNRGFVNGFNGGVVLIATDVNYAGRDAAARSFDYEVYLPFIKINEVTAESPITAGSSSMIQLHYDLIGVHPTNPFPGWLKVTEKGPDVADNVAGPWNYPPGEDQIVTLYFYTGSDTHGNYKFTFEFRVPPDDWNIPQTKTKGSCSVRVEEPPTEGASFTGLRQPGRFPSLTPAW
jgi:hypothetical protein